MSFENLLAAIAEDGERTSLKAIADKYPAVKRYAELGEQVEMLLPRLQKLGPKYDTISPAIDELERWRGWKDKDWAAWETDYQRIKDSLETATQRVQELEARGETEMDANEVKKIVKEALAENGVVDEAKLTSKLTDLIEKQVRPELTNTMNSWGNRFQEVYQKLTPRFRAHEKVFDEGLDATAVFEHMKKLAEQKKVRIDTIDPDEAYNDFYKDKFAAKEKENREAAIAKAKEEGIVEGRKLAAVASGRSTSPVDGGGGGKKMGTLQKRQWERTRPKEGDSIDAPLGKGIIAQQYAQKLREKEMAGGAA
jgi:hypothetical protein